MQGGSANGRASDSRSKDRAFEPHRCRKKRFAYILWKGVFFLASGQGGSSPVLPFRPWLRKANPLESLKVGYWGRITTDNPSLRDRVYDQSWVLEEEG